jgi:hypothetical protein
LGWGIRIEDPIPEIDQLANHIIQTGEILDTMFNGSILAFVAFICSLNVLQVIVDIVVPWLLAFKFKLSILSGAW